MPELVSRSMVGCAFLVALAASSCGGSVTTTDEGANQNDPLAVKSPSGGPGTTTGNGHPGGGSTGPTSADASSPTGTTISVEPDARAPGTCNGGPTSAFVCDSAEGPASAVFKGCSVDDDCTMIRATMCTPENHDTNTLTAYGVAKTMATTFERCFPVPAIDGGCFPVPPMKVNTLAEDGTSNLEGGTLVVKCEHAGSACGRCMTSGR